MYAAFSVMNMVTYLWIVHTEYHPQVHLHIIIDHNPSIDITTAQPHAPIPLIGTEAVDVNPNPTTKDITAKITINPSEHILGRTTGTTGDITGVVQTNSIQTLLHTAFTVTPTPKILLS